jgi:hypothetical protein
MLGMIKNLYRKIRTEWEIERRGNHLRNVLLLLSSSLFLSLSLHHHFYDLPQGRQVECANEWEKKRGEKINARRAKHKSIGKRFRLLCQRKRQEKKIMSDNKSIIAKKAFKFQRLLTQIKSFYISFRVA